MCICVYDYIMCVRGIHNQEDCRKVRVKRLAKKNKPRSFYPYTYNEPGQLYLLCSMPQDIQDNNWLRQPLSVTCPILTLDVQL